MEIDARDPEAPVTPQEAWARYRRAPTPSWIDTIEPAALGADDGAVNWLLLDEQIRFRPDLERYVRMVHRAENDTGVDWLSEIRITFNPSFERLCLHGVNLTRGGLTIDGLLDADIDFMRVEDDMHARVYRGDYLLVIQVRGVQVGDVVEYSYTISGRNSVLGGRDQLDLNLTFEVPVGRHRIRLLDPEGAGVRRFEAGPTTPVQTLVVNGAPEVVVDRKELPELEMEDYVPAEFDDQRTHWALSGFPDWQAVAAWASGLYEVRPDDPAIADLAEQLRRPGLDESIQAAISFTQERIRYVATHFGEGGYRPRKPAEILRRGYGDCKDKCLLLTGLLRALGVQADPALVDSRHRRGPVARAPSPAAFDHVIVRVLVDGDTHWIDATARGQVGPLALRSEPHSAAVLIIRPDTRELTLIGGPKEKAVGSFSEGVFDLTAGPGRSVLVSYTNHAIGADAESLRHWVGSAGLRRFEQTWLGFMSESQGDVEQTAPLRVEDDPQTNTFTFHNELRLLDPWKISPDGGHTFEHVMCHASVMPSGFNTSRRQRPLEISAHPLHHRHVETVLLPRRRRAEGLVLGVERHQNDAFIMERSGRLVTREKYQVSVETRSIASCIAGDSVVNAQRAEAASKRAHELRVTFPARRRSWLGW